MFLTPIYNCRNCKKVYPGIKQEIANTTIDKLIPSARITLGSPEHVFRIGGKVIQLSDLHQCNEHEVGLANFIKIQVEKEEKSK
jgi:hypothetical protein